jgi:hypothetical protein
MRDDNLSVDLLEGWSITLPTGFSRDVEPDGAVVLGNGEITIRATSIWTSGREDGSAVTADEMLGDDLGEHFTFATGVLGAVGEELRETIDGETVFTVPAAAAAANSLLTVFFHSRSPGLASWARAQVETLALESRV